MAYHFVIQIILTFGAHSNSDTFQLFFSISMWVLEAILGMLDFAFL